MTLGMLGAAAVSGTSGSPLSPVLPPGGRALAPFRWAAGTLGLLSASNATRAAAAFAATALIAAGFLMAARASWNGWLSMRLVIGFGMGVQLLALLMPLLMSHDVYHYSMYGRIVAVHHANPYVATPERFPSDPLFRFVGSEWRDVPAFYGPLFLRITALVAGEVRSPAALIWAFKSISAAAVIAAIAVTASLARRLWPERATFAVVALAWNPVVAFGVVGAGHGDSLIALAVVTGVALLVRSRDAASGRRQFVLELAATASLTLAGLMKSPLVIPVVIAIVASAWARPEGARLARLAAHMVVVLACVAVSALPFISGRDPTLGLLQLSSWSNFYSGSAAVQILTGIIFTGTLGSGVSNALATAVRIGFILAFGAVFFVLLRRLARDAAKLSPRDLGAAVAWSLLLFLLAAPILWPWYLVWFLPLLWFLPRLARQMSLVLCAVFPMFVIIAEQRYDPAMYRSLTIVGVGVLAPILLFALIRFMREVVSTANSNRALWADVDANRATSSTSRAGSPVVAPRS